ncbi:addiction module antidote protein [Brucella intermedia]|uniref:addiction module antidote protein n=1 Tax=Brucella intermedia TaxID=94625 RepID=UPI0023612A4D|nr:addiction module antidote protein [Brucella intermedia]
MTNLTDFDVSDYLDSDEMIAEFPAAAMEDDNTEVFITALGHIAEAKGMTEIAKASGFGRESLYKALKAGSKLRYDTVQKVLSALAVTNRGSRAA